MFAKKAKDTVIFKVISNVFTSLGANNIRLFSVKHFPKVPFTFGKLNIWVQTSRK